MIKRPPLKIGIVTLGCDKNTVDSEYFAGVLGCDGAEVVPAPTEPDDAQAHLDAVIINTCGFIADAKAESVRSILAWIERKRQQADAGQPLRVFVAGCLSQRYRESLAGEMPEVDAFLGVGDFAQVAGIVRAPAAPDAAPAMHVHDTPCVAPVQPLPRIAMGPRPPHAFLKIADGCNHNCTFCAIPSFKGRYQSVPRNVLLDEARALLAQGVREINLVAQDTSEYGRDLYGGRYGIADLLRALADLPGDFWLRVLYFYPGGVNDAFLAAMASSPKIVRYLDMPLQHLDAGVLRRMKRPHTEVRTARLVARLRDAIPGIALRTTFLVGFPGETDEEFGRLLRGAKKLGFERMGAFTYSTEEGTVAAAMKPKVPVGTKRRRLDQLMRQQAEVSRRLLAGRVGTKTTVLVEGRLDDGRYAARGHADAPGVDGLVIVTARQELQAGDFVRVRITGADTYDLFARA